jgi:ABC-2 type transport system ATP-binding protein
MSEPLVSVQSLRLQRGEFTLDVPDWQVRPGSVVGLVGPNGPGKTTLLRLLPGLDPCPRGSVRVFGLDPVDEGPRVRLQLGFMADDQPVFRLRIGKLLETLSGYWPSWDERRVEELLERFELNPGKGVWELSKGEATRIRLVCAMAFRPRLLVLDEPATGLDVRGRRQLLEAVLDIVRDEGRSVIISSHQLVDLQRIADELLVLDKGQVVQQGPTDELVGDARSLEEALIAWGAA